MEEIWRKALDCGSGGRRSVCGNRKGTFDEVGEATRKCSIDEIKGREFQVERNSAR